MMGDSDTQLVLDELLYKKRKSDEHDDSFDELANGAISNGIISAKDLRALEEENPSPEASDKD